MKIFKYPLFFLLYTTLLSACSDEKKEEALPPCQDQVSFTMSKEEEFVNTEITFTNTSVDSTIKKIVGGGSEEAFEEEGDGEDEDEEITSSGFFWDFGDGMVDSTGKGMMPHSYKAAGTYTVKLVYNKCGEVSKSITIKDVPAPPPPPPGKVAEPCKIKQGKIKVSAHRIKPGETVEFEEVSGGHQWAWHGSDGGKPTGTTKKISYTFKEPGKYKVFCTINNGDKCINQPMEIIHVVPPPPPPTPGGLKAADIEKSLTSLFINYRKNINLSPEFKKLSTKYGFLVSDQIVDYKGSMESMAGIRAEIDAGTSISSVKVALSPDKQKVAKIIVK